MALLSHGVVVFSTVVAFFFVGISSSSSLLISPFNKKRNINKNKWSKLQLVSNYDDDPSSSPNKEVNRKDFLQITAFTFLSSFPQIATAEETTTAPSEFPSSTATIPTIATSATNTSTATTKKKPFAPNEALQPAVRVKLTIDEAMTLARRLVSIDNSSSSEENEDTLDILKQLESLLLKPQNYILASSSSSTTTIPTPPSKKPIPKKPADLYLQSYKPMNGDLPFQRYLIQNGDVQTWRNLKKQERQQESTNEIRAAFNAYTDALSFSSDSYVLNVDRVTQKNMVREDRLPDVKQVITSDMGMRYLYRNEILTCMDDVQAELEYLLGLVAKQQQGVERSVLVVDGKDLLELLESAQGACDRWFSLIDQEDVRLAIETTKR